MACRIKCINQFASILAKIIQCLKTQSIVRELGMDAVNDMLALHLLVVRNNEIETYNPDMRLQLLEQ